MIRFQQHIPAFAEGGTPFTLEADTLDALLANPWFTQFSSDPGTHFTQQDGDLIAVSDEGFHWWVLGHVTSDTPLDLPKWDGGRYRARLADGTDTVLGPEVSGSHGDVLTLRDGTTATWIR